MIANEFISAVDRLPDANTGEMYLIQVRSSDKGVLLRAGWYGVLDNNNNPQWTDEAGFVTHGVIAWSRMPMLLIECP